MGNENVKAAVEHAFNDNASEMRDALYAAIQDKVSSALETKKVEIAQSLVAAGTEQTTEQE